MDKIIGMGNALVDVLARLEDETLLKQMELPKGSMQLIHTERLEEINSVLATMNPHLAAGGSAANTILGLACLGASTGFIGKTGNDTYGQFFRRHLEAQGIESHLFASPLPSGVASTFISPDGERTFATFLGAAADLKAEELSLNLFKGYSYLFIEGYLVQDHSMILRAIELAKEAGLQVCLDLASYNIVEADREFFISLVDKYVDILFANEEEAKAFTHEAQPEQALDALARRCSIAVVKVGKQGAYVRKGTERLQVAAIPVEKVVDTTGAGDFFAAGFLYGLSYNQTLERCAKMGALLASEVIQTVGTTLDKNRWQHIKQRIADLQAE